MVMMAGALSTRVVYEIENRGKRSHIIGLEDRISGGEIKNDAQNRPLNVYINPGKSAVVTEACGKKLSEGWPNEIKIVKKINKKEDKKS